MEDNMLKQKVFKMTFVFFSILSISLSSFAAVVSDNNGAAFITKSEFDSLKNDFQSQINEYNVAIDSKIEGAIASYLAGIQLNTAPDVYYDKIKQSLGCNPLFLNYIEDNGTENPTTKVNFQSKVVRSVNCNGPVAETTYTFTVLDVFPRAHSAKFFAWVDDKERSDWMNNDVTTKIKEDVPNNAGDVRAMVLTISAPSTDFDNDLVYVDFKALNIDSSFYGGPYYDDIPESANPSSTNWLVPIVPPATSVRDYTDCYVFSDANYASQNYCAHVRYRGTSYCRIGINNRTFTTFSAGGAAMAQVSGQTSKQTDYYRGGNLMPSWEYLLLPDGNKSLMKFYDDYYLNIFGQYTYQVNRTYDAPAAANAFNDTTDRTHVLDVKPEFGETIFGQGISSADGEYIQGLTSVSKIAVASSSDIDYRTVQIGHVNGDTKIYCHNMMSPSIQKINNNLNTNISVPAFTGQIVNTSQSFGALNLDMYDLKFVPDEVDIYSFENSSYTPLAGKTNYLGDGIPIIYVPSSNGDQSYSISSEVLLTDKKNNKISGNVRFMLSEGNFHHCDFLSNDKKVLDSTITCDANGKGTISFNNVSLERGKLYYLNLYGIDDNRMVQLMDFNCKIR